MIADLRKLITNRHRVMCVDPGIGGTGICAWKAWRHIKRYHADVITPPVGTWYNRFVILVDRFEAALSDYGPDIVVIEEASLWAGSKKSMASAIRGDLIKLAYVIGALMSTASICSDVYLMPVREWKGQMSKATVKRRIRAALDIDDKLPEHAADAIGIGLAIKGIL